MSDVKLVYRQEVLTYSFPDGHPFTSRRIEAAVDLLQSLGILRPEDVLPGHKARDEDILRVHDPAYVEHVRRASENPYAASPVFGLATADVPAFPGMHDATAWVVGGALTAGEAIAEGRLVHAFVLGGGLHHAQRDHASGFCIYNDAAALIHLLASDYGMRVLYIDFDAHHGDGVQAIFYRDGRVMTLSLHESGRYLYPGTGFVDELGEGEGFGLSLNVPLDPYTEDDSYLETVHAVVPLAFQVFRPDILVTLHGADPHLYDPLTHLSLSIRPFVEIPKLLHELAHVYTHGRWIALSSGGYDFRVFPRAWAWVWSDMAERPLDPHTPLPEDWVNRWKRVLQNPLPPAVGIDPPFPRNPRAESIAEHNRRTVAQLLHHLRHQM